MAQCNNKRVYQTYRGAEHALKVAWKQALGQGGTAHKMPCRCYKCKQCGKWHLTSKPDWKLTGKPYQKQ